MRPALGDPFCSNPLDLSLTFDSGKVTEVIGRSCLGVTLPSISSITQPDPAPPPPPPRRPGRDRSRSLRFETWKKNRNRNSDDNNTNSNSNQKEKLLQ